MDALEMLEDRKVMCERRVLHQEEELLKAKSRFAEVSHCVEMIKEVMEIERASMPQKVGPESSSG